MARSCDVMGFVGWDLWRRGVLLRSVLAAGGMPILGRAEDGRVEKGLSGAYCLCHLDAGCALGLCHVLGLWGVASSAAGSLIAV